MHNTQHWCGPLEVTSRVQKRCWRGLYRICASFAVGFSCRRLCHRTSGHWVSQSSQARGKELSEDAIELDPLHLLGGWPGLYCCPRDDELCLKRRVVLVLPCSWSARRFLQVWSATAWQSWPIGGWARMRSLVWVLVPDTTHFLGWTLKQLLSKSSPSSWTGTRRIRSNFFYRCGPYNVRPTLRNTLCFLVQALNIWGIFVW